MGCSNSRELINSSNESEFEKNDISNIQEIEDIKQIHNMSNIYQNIKFKTSLLTNSNLLVYTTIMNTSSDFVSYIESTKEKQEKLSFKSSNHKIAIGYRKGYKLEFVNQDKFCILLNGSIDSFIMIDGHGYFGDKLAQFCQDAFFEFVLNLVEDDFEINYIKKLENQFEEISKKLNNKEELTYGEYDINLSGVSVTIIIRIKNILYSANVGNVLGIIFGNDKIMPSKWNITELTFNDSNFSENSVNNFEQLEFEKKNTNETLYKSLIDPEEIYMEIRRIYEHGGEIRKLLSESKSRIFVKGKYYPGLINTRSLGDFIGKGIGVLSKPHITKYQLNKGERYFLLLCTDGISNVCDITKLVNIVQNNGQLLLESVTSIISESRGMYKNHTYTPDMTLMLKEYNFEEF